MSLFDTPQKRIAASMFIKQTFENPVWQDILAQMERANYEALIGAKSSEDRVCVWADARSLRSLKDRMLAVSASGERDIIELANAEAKKLKEKS